MMPISESRQPKNGNSNSNAELTDHDDANSAVAIAQGNNNTAKNAWKPHQYSKGGGADFVVARYIYLRVDCQQKQQHRVVYAFCVYLRCSFDSIFGCVASYTNATLAFGCVGERSAALSSRSKQLAVLVSGALSFVVVDWVSHFTMVITTTTTIIIDISLSGFFISFMESSTTFASFGASDVWWRGGGTWTRRMDALI